MELALDKIKKEIILLKGFNTYYPAWGVGLRRQKHSWNIF